MIDQGKDLYRYKGVISVKGMDKRFVFQGAYLAVILQSPGRKTKSEKAVLSSLAKI